MSTDLYRFYDVDDRLLYVGISLHAAQRAAEHRRDKSWWSDVARMDVEHLPVDRTEALIVEREAIAQERPIHNVQHNSKPTQGSEGPLLTWVCEMCDEPILNGSGYIELPSRELVRYRSEKAEWEAEHPPEIVAGQSIRLLSTRAICDHPKAAHWWAIHRSCDPELDGSGYYFDVSRVRTAFDVIRWTSHLMEKNWIVDTDWDELLGRINTDEIATAGRRPLFALKD